MNILLDYCLHRLMVRNIQDVTYTFNQHHSFQFKAPGRGNGTLIFRALIKHGETNGGFNILAHQSLFKIVQIAFIITTLSSLRIFFLATGRFSGGRG